MLSWKMLLHILISPRKPTQKYLFLCYLLNYSASDLAIFFHCIFHEHCPLNNTIKPTVLVLSVCQLKVKTSCQLELLFQSVVRTRGGGGFKVENLEGLCGMGG